MAKNDLIEIVEKYDSKDINNEISKVAKDIEDKIEKKYSEDCDKLKTFLNLINVVLPNIDNLDDDKLKETFSNFQNRQKLKEELTEQKLMIEDLFKTLETEKNRAISKTTGELREAINNSNERINLKKKSTILFWSNIGLCLLSILLTSLVYLIRSVPLSIVYTCILSLVNIFLICDYIIVKIKLHKSQKSKFDHWQPISYIIFALFIEIMGLLLLFNIKLSDKTALFYVSLAINVPIITFGIASSIRKLKLTDSDSGALALSLSLSLLLFILEESFGSYMPIPALAINILLVLTVLIWTFSIIKNCMITARTEKKTVFNYFALFLEIIIAIGLGFFTIYRIFYYDSDLFANVSTLYASICGGGLTLGGVAWTIRNQEKLRQEEKKIVTKPYVNISNPSANNVTFFIDNDDRESISLLKVEQVKDLKKSIGKDLYYINDIYIRNSNNSNIVFNKIIINDKELNIRTYNFIEKGEIIHIGGLFYFYSDYFEMKFSILDVENKEYLYEVTFDTKYEEAEFEFDDGSSRKLPVYTFSANKLTEIKNR